MTQTTFRQKIGLFLFGLVLTLLFLEGLLRFGGWLFLLVQEQANHKPVGTEVEYRILCLGESTTALGGKNAYPSQLENILNSRQSKIRFKVINKGVPSTTTDQILSRLPQYLAEYQPQMIVAMMGINDPESPHSLPWQTRLSLYSKVFKLFNMIAEHLAAKKNEVPEDVLEMQIAKLERQSAPGVNLEIAKANLYRSANRPEQEKKTIDKILQMDPDNATAWTLLGVHYERQAEHEKALKAYERAMSFSTGANQLTVLEKMAQCYYFLRKPDAAINIYRNILKFMPNHPKANGAIGNVLLEENKCEEAIGYFKEQLKRDPSSLDIADRLMFCYNAIGKPEQAKKISTTKTVSSNQWKRGGFNTQTQKNYSVLLNLASQNKMSLVAVQYPHRPIAPLKEMLESRSGIIYVDNQAVFSKEIEKSGYDAVFSDRFADDFGHCTAKGNALLAGNIAEHILKALNL